MTATDNSGTRSARTGLGPIMRGLPPPLARSSLAPRSRTTRPEAEPATLTIASDESFAELRALGRDDSRLAVPPQIHNELRGRDEPL